MAGVDVMDIGFILKEHTCCYTEEELLVAIHRAYEVIWDQGAKAAALSLGHGGHNADNPYSKEK